MKILTIDKLVKDELIVFFKSKEDMEKNPHPDFKGEFEELLLAYGTDSIPRKLFVGLGEKIDKEKIRKVSFKALTKVHSLKLKSFTIEVPRIKGIEEKDVIISITEAIVLGDYSFNKYKTDKEKLRPNIETLHLFTPNVTLQDEIETAKLICENTNFIRDLVNECSHIANPIMLAKKAKEVAQETGLRCTVLDENDMEELGMGLILAVGRAAPHGPRLIILEHKGNPDSKEKIALIGKGITFDSGGLNLKPASGMLTMKCDMAGAATVLGVLKTCADLKIKKNVLGVMSCAENSIGTHSYRPGDILTSYLKKTVEIGNTDAEGRLVLADAISYTEEKFSPSLIISLATLTGSCVRTFGEIISGIFSREEKITKKLIESGLETFERTWPLPMLEEYEKDNESNVADICNIATKNVSYAGATQAALFLKFFVKETPFVHFDIAGTAFIESPQYYMPKGATGYGVRLLTHFLSNGIDLPKKETKKPEEKPKEEKKKIDEIREEEEKKRTRVNELREEYENPLLKADLPDVFPKI